MPEGILCPQCSTTNRMGAKFCSACGYDLSKSELATIPIRSENSLKTLPLQATFGGSMSNNPRETVKLSNRDTQPLERGATFNPRPNGAIFGDIFLSTQLIFTDDTQHHYIVHQIGETNLRIRICPNPECGAINPPIQDTAIFCTDCGTTLGKAAPKLFLIETQFQLYPLVNEVTKKVLSHKNVRAPIAAFSESLAGNVRYCVVKPIINQIEKQPETRLLLEWGTKLAYGMDYLHLNGVSFNGKIDTTRLGLVDDNVVWANFADCVINESATTQTKNADISALAGLIYKLLTGKQQYVHEPLFSDQLNTTFQIGLSSPGFSNAIELGQSFEKALMEIVSPIVVDYHSGRRTNVGIARSLNEDSLLLIESNRIQQSVSQPIGIYLVADGMGGHAAGEVASTTIVNSVAYKAFTDLLPNDLTGEKQIDYQAWLNESVQAANNEVIKIRKSTGSDLGSTLVAALIEKNNAYIAHVGDSRAYRIDANGIQRMTTDHSLVERLVATGQITPDEARTHPQRNVIYRTIGDKPNVEIDNNYLKVNSGDRILLCSDGLSGMITDEVILRIVLEAQSPQAACDALIDAANTAGGDDNITVILIEITNS